MNVPDQLVVYFYSSPQKDHVDLLHQLHVLLGKPFFCHLSKHDVIEYDDFAATFFPRVSLPIGELFARLKASRFARWQLYKFLPFNRFVLVRTINTFLNALTLRVFACIMRLKIVVIFNHPTLQLAQYVQFLKPYRVIGDCTEYWSTGDIALAIRMRSKIVTNNPYMLRSIRKKTSATLIPAGYFTKKTVLQIYRKTAKSGRIPNSILYLGAIDWRLKFDDIEYLMKYLPHCMFYFLSDELFAYDIKHQGTLEKNMNRRAMMRWNLIRKRKNFAFLPVGHHKDIVKHISQFSVGIVPYDLSSRFYRYVHPVKGYMYLAAGIPFVRPNIQSIAAFPHPITRVYNNKKELLNHVESLLHVPISDDLRKEMVRVPLAQTIEQKARTMRQILI